MPNLPPINHKENDKYNAQSFTTEVKYKNCTHSGATIVRAELRCDCGAAWEGARLGELERALSVDKKKK